MAAAQGKKESVSLLLFMEVNNFGGCGGLVHYHHALLGGRAWWRRWKNTTECVDEADF